MVLAERRPLEVLLEQEAPQIGMSPEPDAEQIEDLALEPVRRRPESGRGIEGRVVGREGNVQPNPLPAARSCLLYTSDAADE